MGRLSSDAPHPPSPTHKPCKRVPAQTGRGFTIADVNVDKVLPLRGGAPATVDTKGARMRTSTFFLRLYTPLSNLGPAQLESRASHECAEALPVRDPAGPTPTHRHGPTISHKAATSLSSTPSPHPQPTLIIPSPADPTPAAFTSCGGAPPALRRERISSIVPLVVAVTVDVRRPEAAVQVCMRSRPQASDV